MGPIRNPNPLAVILLAACAGGNPVAPPGPPPPPPPPPPPAPVASVAITPSGPTVIVGSSAQLTATLRNAQGGVLTGRAVAWSSVTEAIARVSDAGLVTGVAPGSATVRATSEGVIGETVVTVSAVPVATVTLSAAAVSLVPNQSTALVATTRDAQGNVLPGRLVTWNSSAGAIATVNGGLVTAVAVGATQITAMSEGQSAQANVTVAEGGFLGPAGGAINSWAGNAALTVPALALATGTAITVVAVNNPPAEPKLVPGTAYEFGPNGLVFGQPVTIRLKYTAGSVPAGIPATQLRLARWSGAAWIIVAGSTVDPATRTVTGTTTSFSMYAVVALPAAVHTVELSPVGDISVALAGTRQLVATLKDAQGNTIVRPVGWSSTDPAIAKVSNAGLVTGESPGGWVVITATSEGKSATARVRVLAPFAMSRIVAGHFTTCGITIAGAPLCWGSNAFGKLGDGTYAERLVPTGLMGGFPFVQISKGTNHNCAVTAAGAGRCWGFNHHGRLGTSDPNGATNPSPTPVLGGHTFRMISAGESHSCGITTANKAWCWGQGLHGELGDGDDVDRLSPVAVAGNLEFSTLVAATYFTCALTLEGIPYCWGSGGSGKLGNGSNTERYVPTPVSGNHRFVEIDAQYLHVCARTAEGAVWCWGANSRGKLGNGSTDYTSQLAPVRVTGGDVFTAIAVGAYHTCGVTEGGQAKCWGDGEFYQLGNGSNTWVNPSPVLVSGGLKFLAIAAGTMQTCAIAIDGAPWCWGDNRGADVGDGTKITRPVPVKVVSNP